MAQIVSQSLNQRQLEILHLFNHEMNDDDMLAIKRFIVRHFAQKAIESADKVWESNNWNKQDESRLLNLHERTPYKRT
jgi:hypothetical protein